MTTTDQPDEPPVVVIERWRRFGHDRAYVRINGDDVGYRDLKSGALHCTRPELAQLMTRSTDSLMPVQPSPPAELTYAPRHAVDVTPSSSTRSDKDAPRRPRPTPASSAEVETAPDRTIAPDRDLALNQPGALARAEAIALRQAAPIHTFVARALGVKSEERNWRIGADAEEAVAKQLAKLDDRWRVLHAIPVGEKGSDIDHLVIGPAGVFTINTKHHPDATVWVRGDTVKINGHNQHYVRNSRFEAKRATELLSARTGRPLEVGALIVLMGCASFTVKEQPADGRVTVLTRGTVVAHLYAVSDTLDPVAIADIYAAARRLSTWCSAVGAADGI